MPSCLVIQHVSPETPYAIGDALRRAGVELDVRRVFAGDPIPDDLSGLDAVVAMGGPMSASSDDGFPTRTSEIALLAHALGAGLPILGVCLGAQLLAAAAGANVYPGTHGSEIGWGHVDLADEAGTDPLFAGVDAELEVLHWHGDTFDLPRGAVLLASSRRYAHQAFRIGHRAWGFQFHLEVDDAAVQAFLSAFGSDARRQGVDPELIASATPQALVRLAPTRRVVLERFASLLRDDADSLTSGVAL